MQEYKLKPIQKEFHVGCSTYLLENDDQEELYQQLKRTHIARTIGKMLDCEKLLTNHQTLKALDDALEDIVEHLAADEESDIGASAIRTRIFKVTQEFTNICASEIFSMG